MSPNDDPMKRLSIRDVSAERGGRNVLDALSLDIAAGEIVALLGPSGAGKSTLLQLISGLLRPVAGTIDIDGRRMSDPRHMTPPHRRGIGIVFQRSALWPHMRLRDNVAFAMPDRSRSAARSRALELLRAMGVGALAERYPDEVSGGEARRVALARALAARPRVLLLDEPLSQLDRERQASLRELIVSATRGRGDMAAAVWATEGGPQGPLGHGEAVAGGEEGRAGSGGRRAEAAAPAVLWVTHDPDEAMAVADRVLRISQGRLQA